jgi:Phage gp6-like head-tail connector protein
MNLEYIKLALGLDDDSKDVLLSRIYSNVERAIGLYLKTPNETPQELDWIIEECTIVRFNRLGAEGVVQETIDVVSTTYQSDILKDYYPYLDAYLESLQPSITNPNRLRML